MLPARFVYSRRDFLRGALAAAAVAPMLRSAGEKNSGVSAPADLSDKLDAIFGATKIPGAAALVLRGDAIVAQGVYGVRKQGAPEKITLADKFHLGSCTKAMTATLAGLLVDEGKLEWTATLGEIFPDVKEANEAWKRVTLRHVLTHRAGLPPNPPLETIGRLRQSTAPLTEQRRELVAEALARAPESEPGAKNVYSNLGFTLVGAALEKISGQPWEELMRTRLFAPLKITSAGFGAPGTPDKLDQPRGHRGPEFEPVEPGGDGRADNILAGGPAGSVHMTMPDWAKFATLHLQGDPANPRRVVTLLRDETFAALHRPNAGENYIGGWVIAKQPLRAKGSRAADSGVVLWHNGSNTMWFSLVWLAPEIDCAVLLACNAFRDAPPAGDRTLGELIRGFARKSATP